MSKFGEIVERGKVLIASVEEGKTYPEFSERDLAIDLTHKPYKVVKIEKEKNEELMVALGIHFYPSVNYYQDSHLVESFRFGECTNKFILGKLL